MNAARLKREWKWGSVLYALAALVAVAGEAISDATIQMPASLSALMQQDSGSWTQGLRFLMLQDLPAPGRLQRDFFVYQDRVAPTLLTFLRDPEVAYGAFDNLGRFARTNDIEAVLDALEIPWAGLPWRAPAKVVAECMCHPASEAQWKFLERCLRGDYQGVPFYAAVRSLALNGSDRAYQLIEQAERETKLGPQEILFMQKARRFQKPSGLPLVSKDFTIAIRANAERLAEYKGLAAKPFVARDIVSSVRGDRLMVTVSYHMEVDWLCFRKESGEWILSAAQVYLIE